MRWGNQACLSVLCCPSHKGKPIAVSSIPTGGILEFHTEGRGKQQYNRGKADCLFLASTRGNRVTIFFPSFAATVWTPCNGLERPTQPPVPANSNQAYLLHLAHLGLMIQDLPEHLKSGTGRYRNLTAQRPKVIRTSSRRLVLYVDPSDGSQRIS